MFGKSESSGPSGPSGSTRRSSSSASKSKHSKPVSEQVRPVTGPRGTNALNARAMEASSKEAQLNLSLRVEEKRQAEVLEAAREAEDDLDAAIVAAQKQLSGPSREAIERLNAYLSK